jgi:hypothetical protein
LVLVEPPKQLLELRRLMEVIPCLAQLHLPVEVRVVAQIQAWGQEETVVLAVAQVTKMETELLELEHLGRVIMAVV